MNTVSINQSMNALLIGGGILDTKGPDLLGHGLDMTGIDGTPKVLHIPSAKATPESHGAYAERMRVAYRELGIPDSNYRILHNYLFRPPFYDLHMYADVMPSTSELDEKIGEADVVFVAGGNTRAMLEDIWKPHGIDSMVLRHINAGKVITGISAGAIYPFTRAHSDWQSYEVKPGTPYGEWDYQSLSGLGIVDGYVVPHFDDKTSSDGAMREVVGTQACLEEIRNNTVEFGIGIDNYAALEITTGGLVRAVKSTSDETRNNRKSVYVLSLDESEKINTQPRTGETAIPYREFVEL